MLGRASAALVAAGGRARVAGTRVIRIVRFIRVIRVVRVVRVVRVIRVIRFVRVIRVILFIRVIRVHRVRADRLRVGLKAVPSQRLLVRNGNMFHLNTATRNFVPMFALNCGHSIPMARCCLVLHFCSDARSA